MKHIAFVLHNFSTGNKKIELVLPEVWQAASLFDQLQKNFVEFSKYLEWVEKISSSFHPHTWIFIPSRRRF